MNVILVTFMTSFFVASLCINLFVKCFLYLFYSIFVRDLKSLFLKCLFFREYKLFLVDFD